LGLARDGVDPSDELETAGLIMMPVAIGMIVTFTCCGCLMGTAAGMMRNRQEDSWI